MSETAAPKNKTLKVAEVAVDGAEPVVNAVATICSEVEAAANAAIPLGNFLPLIREMSRLLQEMVDINENAVSNKRICRVMLEKVTTAGSVIINLEKDGNLLTEEYYFYLRELVTVADKIRKFLEEISQLKGLSKYIQANKIENTAMDLNKKLDLTIQILQFASELLPYNDFEEVEVGESVGKKIKKYKRIKNGINDFVALKLVADEAKNNIKNLVTILRKLEECDNIIQFFGLAIIDGNKWFLVTEWAEYGNLREFYNTFGPLDVKAKVLFAIDISRGLSFLSAVEIVHCDIRAENILITDHQTAKIANFSSSKAVTDVTKNHKTTLERVRYCAPENSEKLGTQTKYNTKSEVYSFGILLWEIAEEKVPYANYNDIMAITELVGEKKYREPFSDASPLPKEYQDIAKKAVDHDPNYRPSFTKIFTVLQDLYTKTSSNSIGSSSPIGSEWIKKKMEEEDINYFEYNEFSKPIPIGKGGFGFVHKAETNDKKQVALKGLIDSVIDENVIKNFVKELS
ncbi:kinase-like domain-containing protein [Rhizophagus diaphanus]|nr:kinase-like domain-containing protein [Rhizophagus diaphanus] [Rhizophagus sp. MUCL 43196]